MARGALLACLLFGTACAAAEGAPPADPDGGSLDAGGKAGACARSFGDALTADFGRMDGVVTAVVLPSDTQCALPNDDHLVVQVRMEGAIYRMVVNLQSSFGDPQVRVAIFEPPRLGITWREGWHTGVALDYPTHLGLHAGVAPFTPMPLEALAQSAADAIPLDARVSVYAESSGGAQAASAHKIHRNGGNADGLILVEPQAAHPLALAFHFADQAF